MAQNKLLIGVAVVAVLAVGAGVYLTQSADANGDQAPAAAAEQPAEQIAAEATSQPNKAAQVVTVLENGIATLGVPDAPVTVIEYASMTCSHCADFHNRYFPAIKQAYIDTGKVKFEFRPFPLDGLALRASAVATCGGADKYFAYTKTLFATQDSWAFVSDPIEQMANIARLGGMSRAEFDACIADQDLLKRIVEIRAEGTEEHKINATPSFVINGKTVAGEMTPAAFAEHVDPLLPSDGE